MTDFRQSDSESAPSQKAAHPPPETESADARIREIVKQQIYPYKVWCTVITTTVGALLAFFRWDEWPAAKQHLLDQAQEAVDGRVADAVGNAVRQTNAQIVELRERVAGVRDDIFEQVGEIRVKMNDQFDSVGRLVANLKESNQRKIGEVEAMQEKYRIDLDGMIRDGQSREQAIANEISRLDVQKRALEGRYAVLRAEADALSQSQTEILVHADDAEKNLDADVAKAESDAHQAEESLAAIVERSKAIAATMGEDDFVLLLSKLHNDVFRIHSLQARLTVTLPESAIKKFGAPEIARYLARLQVNLRDRSGQGEAAEFAPSNPTLIVTADDTTGEPLEAFTNTGELYELFVPRYKGQDPGALNQIGAFWLMGPSIGPEDFQKFGKDISAFYASISGLRLQIFLNDSLLADEDIKNPKFTELAAGPDGSRRYELPGKGFGSVFVDTRKTLERSLLAAK